jgi:hypothetical protein
MHHRFLPVAILFVALLMGVAGKVIVAAFCATPEKKPTYTLYACHGAVEQSPTVKPDAGLTRIEQPLDGCSHCISHSNLPRTAVALRPAETARATTDIDEPETASSIYDVVLTPRTINARDHAPPAHSSPLHVRLNVFRI